jgi:hypothetical protein
LTAVAVLAGIALVPTVALASTPAPGGLVPLAGERPPLPPTAVPDPSAALPGQLTLTLVLGSGRGARTATPAGPAYQNVRRYFVGQGFRVVRGSRNHLTLTVQAPSGTVESALHTTELSYRVGSRLVYANTAPPALPPGVAASVEDISGLSDLSQPQPPVPATDWIYKNVPCVNKKLKLSPRDCFPNPLPDTLAKECWSYIQSSFGTAVGGSILVQDKEAFECAAAEMNLLAKFVGKLDTSRPLLRGQSQPTGVGQKIGLVEFGSFNTQDVADFLSASDYPASLLNNLSVVQLGNPGPPTVSAEQEILLDVDDILSLAPGAQVVVYEAPQSDSFADVFNAMIQDGDTVISNSWASCENQLSPADLNGTDLVLQAADAAHISVLNAAGDTGSSCGGAADTVSFPADDPNATAVGGSTLQPGPGGTYGSETWWNGTADSPPTGQGGFGVSQEFTRPSYQDGYTPAAGRSVPDVVANADPAQGYMICQADNGGCPTGLLYGGTSVAAPTWAAFVADLNQQVGHDLGFLNPLLYQPAMAATFHGPASMAPASDFAHTGLGSPNLDALGLALEGAQAGPVSPSTSSLNAVSCSDGQATTCIEDTVPADGQDDDTLLVVLTDAAGNTVSGKHVTLTADAGTHSVITPASGTTSTANGAVAFQVTDSTIENVTYTATDTTDGVTLAPLQVSFVAPPADTGGIATSANSVPADGATAATVTVTLETSGVGDPGKTVSLSEAGGTAAITGSGVTGANGQATFSVTDSTVEDVTFSAVDVTDGDLPVPGSVQVDFTTPAGGGNACFGGSPAAAVGYRVSTVLSGLPSQPGSNLTTCIGPLGIAFDASGNLWLLDGYNASITGEPELVEVPKGGGPDQTWSLAGLEESGGYCGQAPCGPWVGLAFGQDGSLYATLQGDVGEYGYGLNGGVVQLLPQPGGVITARTVATTDLPCATGLATDPVSGDLFVTTQDCAAGTAPYTVVRIADPSSASPTVTGYANGCPAGVTGICTFDGLTFGPDGTLYLAGVGGDGGNSADVGNEGVVYSLPGTAVANTTGQPWTATEVAAVTNSSNQPADIDGIAVGVDPADPTVATSLFVNRNDGAISRLDLTADPPTQTDVFAGRSRGDFTTVGPDGCLYATQTASVLKLTNADGSCGLAPTTALPELVLSPSSATLTQGQRETVTATLENDAAVPAGTMVDFHVAGPNEQVGFVRLSAAGTASFSWQGVGNTAGYQDGLVPGTDQVTASLVSGPSTLTSNTASVTWQPGLHVTELSLNPSVTSGTEGTTATLTAALTDRSTDPAAALAGQPVTLSLGGKSCGATTAASGLASCRLALPDSAGTDTLSATFAGTAAYTEASASTAFGVDAPPPPKASGYDMVGSDGGVFVFPTSAHSGFYGSLPGLHISVDNIVGMVPSADDRGYFLVGRDGGVFSFGDTTYEGSLPGLHVAVDDIVGIVPTQDDKGYFLVGRDGGVFSFGDSVFEGSLPGEGVHVDDIVGIAPDNTDKGYWVVGADGTVYAFGDAPALGSAGGLGSPVTGIAATTIQQGYWVASADGNVAARGVARFYGSLPQLHVTPAHPVRAVVPTSDNLGYWLLGADGGVYSFGSTPYVGSLPGLGISVTDIAGGVPTVPN